MYAYDRGTKAGRPSWTYEFEFGRRSYRRGGFVTRRLAELAGETHRRQLRERRAEHVWGVRDPVAVALRVPTLAGYAEVYLADHVSRLARSTQKTARHQVGILLRRLGTHRLYELDAHALDRYARSRLAEVGNNTVREEIERLSRMVNHARGRGVLEQHPFRGYARPSYDRRDYRVVTLAEEAALLTAARADFRDWIVLAFDTGLRKGELRILELAHLTGGEIRLKQPKTKRVKRIPLTPRARGIIRHPGRQSCRFLFSQPDGRSWSIPWIDRRWFETLKVAGLKGIRFNDLRHTFASRLADAGVSVPVVGELLGHKPPYTTTLRYFHPLPEAKEAAIAALARNSTP